MKQRGLILVLLIVLSSMSIYAQTPAVDRFAIFGEILNPREIWEEAQWSLFNVREIVDTLRFNYGTVRVRVQNKEAVKARLNESNTEFGIRFSMLDDIGYAEGDFSGKIRRGRRWVFHPESPLHIDRAGCTGDAVHDPAARLDADAATKAINCIQAIPNSHQSDTLLRGPKYPHNRLDILNRSSQEVYFRARMKRAAPAGQMDDVLCTYVALDSVNGEIGRRDILVRQISDTGFVESPALACRVDSTSVTTFLVLWPGSVTLWIDFVAIDNAPADSLCDSVYRGSVLNGYVDSFVSQQPGATYSIRLDDEVGNHYPDSLRMPVIGLVGDYLKGYVRSRSGQSGSDVCAMSFGMPLFMDDHGSTVRGLRKYMRETNHDLLITDCYPFPQSAPATNVALVQDRISYMVEYYRGAALAAQQVERPWFSLAQIYSYRDTGKAPEHWLREPTTHEIAVQAHVMASLGARGVGYYKFDSYRDSLPNLTPQHAYLRGLIDSSGVLERTDTYGLNRTAAVRNVNLKLEKFGPTLLTTTLKGSARETSELPTLTMYDSTQVTNVAMFPIGSSTADTAAWYHIGRLHEEPGHGAPDETEYLYAVNTRVDLVDGSRRIDLTLQDSTDIIVERMDSTVAWVLPPSAVLSDTFGPGDGHLYRFTRGVLRSGILTDSITHVSGTLRLPRDLQLVVDTGYVIEIQPGGAVECDEEASIVMNGGHLVVNGRLVLDHAQGLRGKGSISGTGEIVWKTRADSSGRRGQITTLAGDALTFAGALTFSVDSCMQGTTVNWTSWGALRFLSDPPAMFTFSTCIDTLLIASDTMTVERGVTMVNGPNLVNYPGSAIHFQGSGLDSCRWLARDMTHIDIYGSLHATTTCFAALDSSQNALGWAGLGFAYEDARCAIDSCLITGIHVQPATAQHAVHLYAALNAENHVRYSKILRSGAEKLGDAVFLQSGPGTDGNIQESRLQLACTLIEADWYSGVASVGSAVELFAVRALGGANGAVGDLGSTMVFVESCLADNVLTGLQLNSGSIGHLGAWSSQYVEAPRNRIAGNGGVQCLVTGMSTLHGAAIMQPENGCNHIDHVDSTVLRMQMQDQSSAYMPYQYWGGYALQQDSVGQWILPPAIASQIFLTEPGCTLTFTPVHPSTIAPTCHICSSEDPNPFPFPKSSPLPSIAADMADLPRYARAGNFAEVYRYLAQYGAQTPAKMVEAGVMALALERAHAASYPDSIALCRSRALGFLSTLAASAPVGPIRAGCAELLAQTECALGSVQDCETATSSILAQYPGTRAAERAMQMLLVAAMVRDAGAQVQSILGGMETQHVSENIRRTAHTMTRGYERFLPRHGLRFLPKRTRATAEEMEGESMPVDALLGIRNYPNGFSEQTTIEYWIPEEMPVSVRVYNVLGQSIATLADGVQRAGRHTLQFIAAGSLPSGLYLAVLSTSYGMRTTVMHHRKGGVR
jgi:hypothetical protein